MPLMGVEVRVLSPTPLHPNTSELHRMASKPVTTGSSGLIIMSAGAIRFHCTEMRRAARCEPESTYVVWVPGTLSAPRRHPGACVGSSRSSRLASGHFDGGRCGRFACDGSAPVVRPRISGIVLSTDECRGLWGTSSSVVDRAVNGKLQCAVERHVLSLARLFAEAVGRSTDDHWICRAIRGASQRRLPGS